MPEAGILKSTITGSRSRGAPDADCCLLPLATHIPRCGREGGLEGDFDRGPEIGGEMDQALDPACLSAIDPDRHSAVHPAGHGPVPGEVHGPVLGE